MADMAERSDEKMIRINVRGRVFECLEKTFDTFPGSKLATLFNDGSSEGRDDEYYFDRSSTLFEHIIDSYVTGSVHFPRDMCPSRFKEEMEFWGLSVDNVALCCWKTFCKADDASQTLKEMTQTAMSVSSADNPVVTLRQRVWLLIEEPRSSRIAFVWAIWMTIVITSSVVISALQTVSSWSRTATDAEIDAINQFLELGNFPKGDGRIYKIIHPELMVADMVCFFFITLEIILQFLTCPSRKEWLKCVTHWLQCIACASFWTSATLNMNMEKITTHFLTWVWVVTSYLTILKLVRLVSITRHIPAFRIINMTLNSSKQEFGVFVILLSLLSCLFGYSVYIADFFENTKITTVFRALYWAVITLTTVGYGDYTPESVTGKILASLCALCGLLVLAMPSGIIVSNFHNYYSQHLYMKRYMQAHKDTAAK